MSSLQSLIEGGGDCGAANPVVELARQFTQSTSSSAVAEDPTTSLLRDIHHPETLVGQQQSQGHQQQQPIGASFSAAAAAQHLLNSSRSSVQQLEQKQNSQNSAPFDMNLLLEQMREMDSAMERAMKRGHDQQDQQDHHLGEVLGDELAAGGGKLSGSTDPFLGSASLEDETSSSAVDFGGFGDNPSSSSLIDESWEEALLATVGTPDALLSAEEAGGGNNWVDEYFRTLDAQVDRQEEAEEAAHQAERQSYRGRPIAATAEDSRQQELKNVTAGGPGLDDFSAFFQSMSSTIDRVASSKAPSSSSTSQLPQGVRAEVTFNLSELVSDQEERLMNMLLSGGGGGAFQEEDEDIITSSAAKQFHPDELLNLDAIGRKEEETESEKASSSDFKMPSSLLNSTISPQESQRQQQPQPQKPEEKFFYENQFDDMEFWMKLAEEWEHSSNPLDLEAALNEATTTAKQPAVPVVHEPLEELLKPDHLHHYHFVLENPFLKVEEDEEAVQEGSEAMKTDEAKEDEENDDFEEYIRRGLAKLEVGDIPAAILLFEAAAATAPSSARAWLLLGTAQAKNENDRKAIGAMKRCLALDPANLEALLCLAISFTNESQTAEACAALREWLAAHPKYGHFLAEAEAEAMEQEREENEQKQYMGPTPLSKRWGASTSATANSANIFESGLFERIKGVFIRAATETTETTETSTAETMDTAEDQQEAAAGEQQRLPDADVQCGLGVLFSLSGDYEKAADCFRTAVAVRPQEHTLWNRLGATLANGGHSAQAMAAYREALVRYPGYIRARHNLAIACLMLGAEREAVGHLLAVLNLQTAGSRSAVEGGGGEAAAKSSALAEIIANPSSITSAAVWSLLRTALLALHREDLFPAVGDRNLPLLNREFSFGEEEQEKSSAED